MEGLAAWGYPLFTRVEPGTPKPDLAELIEACLASGNPRFEGAVIALLLLSSSAESRGGVSPLAARLSGKMARSLRWLTLAADYLAQIYGLDVRVLLGRDAHPPVDLFNRGALPPRELDDGEAGLRALAEELCREEDAWLNWAGSFEDPVRKLVKHHWIRKGAELARARHAGAG